MTTIYLIRHAEAEGNLYRRIHGQYDSLITPNGYRQIRALAQRFAPVPVDAVYSSDLFRTMTTARAIYVPKHLPLTTRADLREIHMGSWEDRSWAGIDRAEHDAMALFSAGSPQFRAPGGGETFREVRERMSAALLEIAAAHPNQTVAVFSHGTAIRNVLAHFLHYSHEQFRKMGHSDNTAVNKLESRGNSLQVVYMDDNSHVPKDISTLARQHWWNKDDSRVDVNLWFAPFDLTRPEDRQAYRTARQEAWDNLYHDLSRYDGPGFLADAEEAWRRDHRCLQFAMAGAKPVGILQLEPRRGAEEHKGYIPFFYVTPDSRSQGIGVQLLGKAVNYYRPLGRDTLQLVCSQYNGPALGFYEKYGFVKTGETAGAYGALYQLEKYIGYEYRGELD